MRKYGAVILVCAIVTGCGKPSGPAKSPEAPAAASPQGAVSPPPGGNEPAAPATFVEKPAPVAIASRDDFDGRMREVVAAENDTDFVKAIALCEAMQNDFKDIGQTREMSETLRRLNNERKAAGKLTFAVQRLGSDDLKTRQVAGEVLDEAGELGLVFLRHALRTQETPVALGAGQLLMDMVDADALPVFLGRLVTEPLSPVGRMAARAFILMANSLDGEMVSRCLQMVRADDRFVMRHVVDVLEAVLVRAMEEDEQAFNEAAGHPNGMDVLRDRFGKALLSGDPAVVEWACGRIPAALPLLNGLRADYFTNAAFEACVLSRNEGAVRISDRAFPMPDGRQDNISARWTGTLEVQRAGEYTFTIACAGQSGNQNAKLWVDDKLLLELGRPSERSAKMALSNGWHSIRMHYVKGDGGGSFRFGWSGPSARLCSRPWPAAVAGMAAAVSDLGSTNYAAAWAAEQRLASSSALGRLFLFNAIKTESGERRRRATDLLCGLAREIEPGHFPALYQAAVAEGTEAINPRVSILCSSLLLRNGDPEAFNKLVNDGNGYHALAKHVQDALSSASMDAVRRACEYGAPFAPRLQGLVGRYFIGQDFSNLALEIVDSQINIPNRRFPYPDKRQDDISARWTGYLNVDAPGEYTFIVNARGAANVWVDDRRVSHSSGWGEHKKDPISLAKGWHKLRVDTWQAGGNNQVQLQWIPPGGNRDWIPPYVLTSPPTAGILAQVEKAVAGLSSAKPEDVAAASGVLRGFGDVSIFFLRRTLREAKGDAAASIVPLLVEMRDLFLADLIRELRKSKSPLAPKIEASLEDLAKKGDRRHAGWFYAVMKEDKALEFQVCGRFLPNALQDACKNNEGEFNSLVGDQQGAATLKAYLDKLPKPTAQ